MYEADAGTCGHDWETECERCAISPAYREEARRRVQNDQWVRVCRVLGFDETKLRRREHFTEEADGEWDGKPQQRHCCFVIEVPEKEIVLLPDGTVASSKWDGRQHGWGSLDVVNLILQTMTSKPYLDLTGANKRELLRVALGFSQPLDENQLGLNFAA